MPDFTNFKTLIRPGSPNTALLAPPGASPHNFGLRPSQAAALEAADLVVWSGADLVPWLALPIATLGGGEALDVSALPGVIHIAAREGGVFDDGADHGGQHDHDHGGHEGEDDPHRWLDPRNAAAFAYGVAEALAEKDPGHAALYRANAQAFGAQMAALETEIAALLGPVAGRRYLSAHDALRYFEARFGLSPLGALTGIDDAKPGARRVAAIRAAAQDAACALADSEVGGPAPLRAALGEGIRIEVADPMGAEQTPGPDHYAATMRALAAALRRCLDS